MYRSRWGAAAPPSADAISRAMALVWDLQGEDALWEEELVEAALDRDLECEVGVIEMGLDWGYTRILGLRDLDSPEKQSYVGLVVEDRPGHFVLLQATHPCPAVRHLR